MLRRNKKRELLLECDKLKKLITTNLFSKCESKEEIIALQEVLCDEIRQIAEANMNGDRNG